MLVNVYVLVVVIPHLLGARRPVSESAKAADGYKEELPPVLKEENGEVLGCSKDEVQILILHF